MEEQGISAEFNFLRNTLASEDNNVGIWSRGAKQAVQHYFLSCRDVGNAEDEYLYVAARSGS